MLDLRSRFAHRARHGSLWLRPAWLVVLVVAAMVLAGGCQGGSKSGPPETAPSAAASVTSATGADARVAAERAVLSSYRAFWDDVVAAGRRADWQSPRLADHATGQALQEVRDHYRALRAAGMVDLGTVELHPKVVDVGARTATVNDCVDVSRFLRHDAKTLEPRETPDLRPDAGVATLTLIDGAWKVTRTVRRGKCAKG
jgi:hypothetical protein